MARIKILHIIKSLGRGGAEMLLPETLKLHDTSKFEFHYIYFLPWKDQMVEEIKNAGGAVKCLNASNNFKILKRSGKVIKYIKENKIDLIHCHLPWAGFLGRLVHYKIGIPTVYSEHNMQERYHKITAVLNKLSFNYQNLALGVSEDVTKSIKENINPNIPVVTLLNGVNTKSFKRTSNDLVRKDLNIPANAVVLGNVAVFRFQKRLIEWLRVFHKISQSNSNVYGIIVGAGPLEEEIKNEWSRLNLESKVFFPGLKTEVKPYFEAFDIFMMSSSFEGLPIALLEAMSMNCAIVSTDAGGIKEVIRDQKDGLLCSTNNWQKLSDLVSRLIINKEKLNILKNASRERVVEEFSLTNMVSKLENHYQDLLK